MKKTVQIVFTIIGLMFTIYAFSQGGIRGFISGLIVLASALFISPLSEKILTYLRGKKLNLPTQMIGSFILLVFGIGISPTSAQSVPQDDTHIETTATSITTTEENTPSVIERSNVFDDDSSDSSESENEILTSSESVSETITTTAEPVEEPETTNKKSKTTTTTKAQKTTTTTKKTTTSTTTTTTTPKTTTTIITTKELRQYMINHDSKIVHRPSCRTIPDTLNENWQSIDNLDINWAEANGYRACKICEPIWHN